MSNYTVAPLLFICGLALPAIVAFLLRHLARSAPLDHTCQHCGYP